VAASDGLLYILPFSLSSTFHRFVPLIFLHLSLSLCLCLCPCPCPCLCPCVCARAHMCSHVHKLACVVGCDMKSSHLKTV
jgi:hypothetical protein